MLFVIPLKNDANHLMSLLRVSIMHRRRSSQKLVPFCLHALGAVSLEQSHIAAPGRDLTGYDYVVVEDRGSLSIPPVWLKSGKVCNVIWLKQCLVGFLVFGELR